MDSPTSSPSEEPAPLAGPASMRVGVTAGLEVWADVAVVGLAEGGFSDARVEIVFAAQGAKAFTDGAGGGWCRVADGRPAEAFCREDGEQVVIDAVDDGDVAVQLRRVVPFASALQGKVVLHAAGVEVGGRVVAFVGESGAGKSTLARALESSGLASLADDLLPCRVSDGQVCVPVGAGGAARYLPVCALAFLQRERGPTRVRRGPLTRPDCLRALLHHGFGEMEAPRAWKAQFDLYGSLAAQASAWLVRLPDDLGLLPAVTKALVQDEIPAMLHVSGDGS